MLFTTLYLLIVFKIIVNNLMSKLKTLRLMLI
ncbi:unnamed protein product [Staphylococcus haemolyticus JCSC1435]|uniref:Uncharacterized protein n=1 Tax=Staphylococcus haemolyticus (strain JCSC1435) TaxID=279808 RepID=Q4L3L7_STAHJ|nr:unnamed protein product [Staphylococcus haemolyticus JCSC1435]